MEYAMLDTLIETCQNKGIKKIRGFYYPTAKNAMVKDFYGKMGFSQVACDAAGTILIEPTTIVRAKATDDTFFKNPFLTSCPPEQIDKLPVIKQLPNA